MYINFTGCGRYCEGCSAMMAECGKIKELLGNIECRQCCTSCCSAESVKSKVPIVKWLPTYRLPHFQGDLIAGLTVGLTVIPQGLAYAVVADLPPQYGLYSAFIGCFIYCFFGTSKDITLGPTAIMSLMTGTFCQYQHFSADLSPDDKQQLQNYFGPIMAIMLSLVSGIVQLLMGVFKIGFLVDFISHPVINSFTTAAAITIGCSQFNKWLGLSNIPRDFIHQVIALCKNLPKTRIWDFVLGLTCMILLYTMKRLKDVKLQNLQQSVGKQILLKTFWLTNIARNAIVIGLSTLLVYCVDKFSSIQDIESVFSLTGTIAPGIPLPSLPKFSGEYMLENNTTPAPQIFNVSSYEIGSFLGNSTETTTHNPNIYTLSTKQLFTDIGSGLIITPLLGLVETIAIGKAFARVNKYKMEANQELIAIGASNIVGCFFSAYPVTGSFSRTAVNSQSGVRTPAGGIFTGALVIVALALLTPMFYYIPQSAMAGVIMMAVYDMIDFSLLPALWRVKKADLLPWSTTFFLSFILGIEYGIIIGVAVSLCLLLIPWNRPDVEVIELEEEPMVASSVNYGSIGDNVVTMQISQGLRFPGIDILRQKILTLSETGDGHHKSVILDMRHVATLDFSVVHGIEELLHEFHEMEGRYIVLTHCNQHVLSMLRAQEVSHVKVYASNLHALHALNHELSYQNADVVLNENTPLHNGDPEEAKVHSDGAHP